jgi:hypothetical protein
LPAYGQPRFRRNHRPPLSNREMAGCPARKIALDLELPDLPVQIVDPPSAHHRPPRLKFRAVLLPFYAHLSRPFWTGQPLAHPLSKKPEPPQINALRTPINFTRHQQHFPKFIGKGTDRWGAANQSRRGRYRLN